MQPADEASRRMIEETDGSSLAALISAGALFVSAMGFLLGWKGAQAYRVAQLHQAIAQIDYLRKEIDKWRTHVIEGEVSEARAATNEAARLARLDATLSSIAGRLGVVERRLEKLEGKR